MRIKFIYMALSITVLILSLLADAGVCVYLGMAFSWWWMFLLPVLWFFIDAVIFGLWVLILVLWGPFLNKKKPTTKPSKFYYSIVKQTDAWVLAFLRIHVHVRGVSLPKEPYVLISNHRSNFDQMAQIKALKGMLICISKPENMDFPIAGPFIHHAGFLPINRENMVEGVKTINQASSYLTKGYCNIGISPEGTRNKGTADLLPFHPGSFRAAMDVKAPIVICCIKNTDKIKHRTPWKRSDVFLDMLEVLPYQKYKDMSPAEVAEYCSHLIKRDLDVGNFLLGQEL